MRVLICKKVTFTLEQAIKAQREFMQSSTPSLTPALNGVGGQRHAPAALSSEMRPGTHCKEVSWAPGPVWTGVENDHVMAETCSRI